MPFNVVSTTCYRDRLKAFPSKRCDCSCADTDHQTAEDRISVSLAGVDATKELPPAKYWGQCVDLIEPSVKDPRELVSRGEQRQEPRTWVCWRCR